MDKSCQNFANVGLLRTEENSTIFPGDFLKIKAPPTIAMLGDVKVFISPRNSKAKMIFMNENRMEETIFPLPGFTHVVDGHVMLPNSSNFPVNISKNQQLADIRIVSNYPSVRHTTATEQFYHGLKHQ